MHAGPEDNYFKLKVYIISDAMRKNVFSGSFYSSDGRRLISFINGAINSASVPIEANNAVSYVAPHAGYIYSGKTAAFTYKAMLSNPDIKKVDSVIVVGPNHTGMGQPISISYEDWETPLGICKNDKELSKEITDSSDHINIDEYAHENEHSIEVELPFMQHVIPGKKFSFVCMGDQSIEASELLTDAIIKASEKLKRNITIIASSDFNHYESADIAKRKDSALLNKISILDYKNFNKLVYELNDSACGFGPITVAMLFAKHAGAKKGIVLRYSNSGESTGDYSSVVAYSSVAFITP